MERDHVKVLSWVKERDVLVCFWKNVLFSPTCESPEIPPVLHRLSSPPGFFRNGTPSSLLTYPFPLPSPCTLLSPHPSYLVPSSVSCACLRCDPSGVVSSIWVA